MVRIELTGPGWAVAGRTHARGYAHGAGRYLSGRALAAVVDAATTDDALEACIRGLNGCFAIVTGRDERVIAAVDRLRSMPLFYGRDGDTFAVSDSAYRIRSDAARGLDPIAEAEFCLTGYVTGSQTLRPEVSQVEAGALVRISGSGVQERRYYDFRHGDFLTDDAPELIGRLEQVHANVFARLVEGIGDRPIAVPLSGGFDSRLIGLSLRDLGARNVVCYTYGTPGHWEARISQELARYLGFRWEFVEYSADRWRAWRDTDAFARYFHDAGNLTSVPHLQDWPAVRALIADGRIAPDSVFVPGHSGDFVAGSHIPASFGGRASISRQEVLDTLLAAHYSLWDWPVGREAGLRARFERRIEAVTGPLRDGTPEEAADAFERWDLRERQAKFICNSVRVYESEGCEWRLPLFDHELMDFWSRIPIDLRIGRRLYFAFARQRQALPVTEANTDRNAVVRTIVRGIDAAGLRPAMKRLRQAVRKSRWRHEYASSPLGWLALVDPGLFGRTYTGKELFHSYMALRYRDLAASSARGPGGAADAHPHPR